MDGAEGAPGSLRPKAGEEPRAVTQWREEEVPAEEATCIKAWWAESEELNSARERDGGPGRH